MSCDPTKPYRQRNRRAAKLFTMEGRCKGFPWVGERETDSGDWQICIWNNKGIFSALGGPSEYDLVNYEPEYFADLYVFEDKDGALCGSTSPYINNAKYQVGCMKIKLERRWDAVE